MKASLYDLVGVPPDAPREMVASACRRRVAKLERETGDQARAEIYAIREAWSILGDEKLRAGYDASLAAPKPDPFAAASALDAEIRTGSVAATLLRRRTLLPGQWEGYRKLVGAMLVVGFIALSLAWNQGNRVAVQKKVEAAEYEATYGEPMPDPRKAAAVEEAKQAEPFSAEKFEQELKEREAQIREQVAKEQTAKEDEFRDRLQDENASTSSRRRSRNRR
jgi:curved DNA-binding protein CbpA